MAKQVGEIAIIGTIGNMNFYRYKGNIVGRMKSSLTKEKVMSSPNMEGTRRSMSEMGRASKGSKLLRHSVFHLATLCEDSAIHNRLTSVMRKVINSDGKSDLGFRVVENGSLQLLKGFKFNINCGLENVFYGDFTVRVNRSKGLSNIKIGSFSIQDYLRSPKAATHFQFVGAMVEIDFAGRDTWRGFSDSDIISTYELVSGDILMEFKTRMNSKWPMFFVMGIHFYEEVNGVIERLAESVYNGLDVVWVDEG